MNEIDALCSGGSCRSANGARRRRAGFTLSEIMIALGVIVVALSMVAGAFHAGIKNHQTTIDEILRMMIGQNALAVARVRLDEDVNVDANWTRIEDSQVGPSDKQYPIGKGDMGYVLYASRPDDERNDFQFMIIPYTLTVKPEYREQVNPNLCTIETQPLPPVTVNNPVIDRSTGKVYEDKSLVTAKIVTDAKTVSAMMLPGSKIIDIADEAITVAPVAGRMGKGVGVDADMTPGVRPSRGKLAMAVLTVKQNKVTDVSSMVELTIMDTFRGRTALPPAK